MFGFVMINVIIVLAHIVCAIYFFGYKHRKDLKKNVSFFVDPFDTKNSYESERYEINPKYFKLINYAFIDSENDNEKV